jgi:hypothetical protein
VGIRWKNWNLKPMGAGGAGSAPVGHRSQILAGDADLAGGEVDPGNQIEQGGLAAAASAADCDELSLAEFGIQAPEDLALPAALKVNLGQSAERDEGRHFQPTETSGPAASTSEET